MARRRTRRELSYALVIGGLAVLALVILVGPILIVLATSFTDSRSIRFPPHGLLLPLVRAAAGRRRARARSTAPRAIRSRSRPGRRPGDAARHRGGAGARARAARPGARLDAFFMSPLVLPGLAFGLAALMYFTLLGFRPSLELLIAGHLIVVTPFVLRTVGASPVAARPGAARCLAPASARAGSTPSAGSPCR